MFDQHFANKNVFLYNRNFLPQKMTRGDIRPISIVSVKNRKSEVLSSVPIFFVAVVFLTHFLPSGQ